MIVSSEDTTVKKLSTLKKGDVDLLNSYENLVMCMVPCNCLCWNVCGFQIIKQAVGDHICFQYEQALCDLFISPEHI